MDALVHGMIAEARQRPRSGHLVSLLLAQQGDDAPMSHQQLRDEVMSLLVGGHETSATTLAWTLYLIGKHKSVEQRLKSEIEAGPGSALPSVSSLQRMPYLNCVIEETMRLYPPVWFLMRRAAAADQIGGQRVSPGQLIFFSPYTLHRQRQIWRDPESFIPERFDPGNEAGIDRWAYIPFSVGPRACVGRGLAMMQMQLILATVLQRYSIELASDAAPQPEPMITLNPRGGVHARLRRRLP